MDGLNKAVAAMRSARSAYADAKTHAWVTLLSSRGDVRAMLDEVGLSSSDMGDWFCEPCFDGNTRSAVELIADGRLSEVYRRVVRIAHWA